MKSYIAASKFPLVEIAGRKIPRIILGQHPYDGTTYTSWTRDQAFRQRWNGPSSMLELLLPIVQRFGVTMSREYPSDTDLSRWHQAALQLTMAKLDTEIALVLGTTLPTRRQVERDEYLYRLCYQLAGESFAKIWRMDPIIHYRYLERMKASQADIDDFAQKAMNTSLTIPMDLRKAEVDYEEFDTMLTRYQEFTIPLYASNAGFELLVLAKRFDELREICQMIRHRIGNFLLGTHHAGLIIPLVEDAGIPVDGYLTPINATGIYMFPTQQHVVDAIQNAGKPVVAIKPLGGGRVPPTKAFKYLFQELNIPTTMVGVSNMEEAQETFGAARDILQNL